jgi:hypothetical protein
MALVPRAVWISLGALGVLALGGVLLLVVYVASTGLGTSITRSHFRTEREAVDFVSDHLPVPLPPGATVSKLDYSRFTDWHLQATVELATPAAAEAYVASATTLREPKLAQCDDGASSSEVAYSLAKWHACGRMETSVPASRTLRIECGTQ